MTDVQKPQIILVEPQLGENIGMAARAMANFGLSDMRLVNPRDGWPNEMAVSAASGANFVVENAKVFQTLQEAVADLHYIVATTARPRDMVKMVLTPEEAACEMHKRVVGNQKTGILFGRERIGLKNDEIALADAIVMAPVNPEFASLNIAQAVLLIGYEWLKQSPHQAQFQGLGRETEFDGPGFGGLNLRESRPANREELVAFFEHLEKELDESGFFKTQEKRAIMVRNLRNMFLRIGATEQEVRTLRGVVASLTRSHKSRHNIS